MLEAGQALLLEGLIRFSVLHTYDRLPFRPPVISQDGHSKPRAKPESFQKILNPTSSAQDLAGRRRGAPKTERGAQVHPWGSR